MKMHFEMKNEVFKMHNCMTLEEQIADLKKRMERVGYRNLWLECESESLKGVIRDQRKEIETLHHMLLERFQEEAKNN